MEYRQLGSTGMRVSLVGFGTVKLGRTEKLRYPKPFTIPDAKTAAMLLEKARELGINLIDTAPAYGSSEQSLGVLLKGRRQDWILCTKVGEEFPSRFDFSPEWTIKSVKRSMERLATDYLDIVLIHSNGEDLEILNEIGTLETLQDLKHQGLIRAVGISHKTVAGARSALAAGADVIMATLNPSETEQIPVIADAGGQGCGVLVKKALASGYGQPADLAWAAGQAGVSSIVVGTIDEKHLTDNVEAACSHFA